MKLDGTVQAQLSALVAEEGLELLATEVVGSGPKTILRLVVDGPDGVNLDQCATVSRQASAILDVDDPIHHRYTLEVSSPGLDRKLYRPEDFQKFVARYMTIPELWNVIFVQGEASGPQVKYCIVSRRYHPNVLKERIKTVICATLEKIIREHLTVTASLNRMDKYRFNFACENQFSTNQPVIKRFFTEAVPG